MKTPFLYKFLKVILTPIFKFYYNPKIIGKENIVSSGPMLIAGNHKHLYDQCLVIMSTSRYLKYMAKSEYFDKKLSSMFFRSVGCIPVHRDRKDNMAVNEAINTLKCGDCIGIFPEGTRNRSDSEILLPFKFGTVSMANKTDSYIVPFGITGDFKFRSKNLMIRFGVPFKVLDMTLDEANIKLYNEVKNLILKNLEETNRTLDEEIGSHMKKKN